MKVALVVAALCAALAASPGQAATITVGGGCSIVDAVRAANTNTARGGCPAGDPNFNVRDTVVLQSGATYIFTTPYAPEVGPAPEATALPHLTSVITIQGNGAVLQRSTASGTPKFRLLRASGGNVIVNDITLRGGDQTTNGGVGGGMYASSAFVTLNGVTIEDNSADTGGGLAGTAPFTLNRLTVRRNRAELTGGGGLYLAGTSVVQDSTIAENTAVSHGGGISSELSSGQPLTVLRSTVSGNEAGYGGGIFTSGGVPTIANSTISGNRATEAFFGSRGGAGIHANFTTGGSVVRVVNSTVAANTGVETGGIVANAAAVRLANSIVIGNSGAPAPDCTTTFNGGSITSEGSNLFALGSVCGQVASDRTADSTTVFTQVLRPLAVSPPGGMQTHRLWKQSPALDGGSDTVCAGEPIAAIDQRGVSRAENGPCDIGAYEAQRADLELAGWSFGRPPVGTNTTLTFTLRNDGPSPASGIAVAIPLPTGLAFVSAGGAYDPATSRWSIGSLAKGATATLAVVVRVDGGAVFDAEVAAFDQEDPDSDPANGLPGEDDQTRVAVTPPGIWVNTTLEAAKDDGLCNIVEAVFAAESDTAPFGTPGECTAGSGADTIHLQPSAKYVSTDVWLSGDAFPAINSSITIEGNGASIERGITPKFFRAMQVLGGGVLTLRNLGMHFFETRDETCGGAIHLSFGSLVLDNVFLSQNRVRNAYMGGGAICNMYGRLTASNSRIEDNTVDVSESAYAARGGGITTNGEPAVTTLTNTSVRNNVVTSGSFASGGGLEVVNGATLTLTGGSVLENRIQLTGLTSQAFGGGISAEGDTEPAEVRITGTSVRENRVDAVGDNRTALGGGLALRFASGNLVDAAVGDLNSGFGNQAVGGGGGIYVAENADLGITRGLVSGNTASAGRGGGGILSDGGLVDLRDVELAGNGSAGFFGDGGAIKSSGRLVIAGGTIWENAAPSAGGIDHQAGDLEIDGAVLFRNSASVGGGALRIGGPGTKVVKNTTISNNSAGGMGGGVWTSSTTTLVDSTVTENRLTGHPGCGTLATCPAGGGIHATAQLRLTDSQVTSNVAPGQSYGGGIWSENTVLMDDSLVSQNAAQTGGGVYMEGGWLDAHNSTFSLNQALVGGGLALAGGNRGDVSTSTIDGNRASAEGGGMWLGDSDVTLWTATVSRNAAELGGAVYRGRDSRLDVFASTITGNDALRTGGIYSGYRSWISSIEASIVAGNRTQDDTGPPYADPDCEVADGGSAPTSSGGNLVGRGIACSFNAAGDRPVDGETVASDVIFPLADNGGPTLTHALRPSSPALDLVDPLACASNDQRGDPRPKDGDGDGTARCDSGAVEQQAVHQAPLVLQSLNPSARPANTYTPVIVVQGSGFTPQSTVRVGGVPRLTEWRTSRSMYVYPHEEDFQSTVGIRTVPITVHRQDGAVSNPVPLTLTRPGIDTVQSGTAVAGSSASVSAYPTTIGLGGSVAATLTNNGGSPATVTAATYHTNPTSGSAFTAGGFVDVQITGADPSDRVTITFYYPHTIQGAAERQLELRFWTGTAWKSVRGQGGARPVKDTTDNPDGTGMGGKFTVTLGNSSTPRITELTGTVLATDLDAAVPTTTATVSPGATGGWHAGDVTVTLAVDEASAGASTEWTIGAGAFQPYTAPFTVSSEGVNTVRYRSTSEGGNTEADRSLEVRIDKTAPSATVAALPATRPVRFTVSWSGTDAGSGIASYDVFVSTNGGPFTRIRAATTETSTTFTGAAGRRYGFAAAGTDRAGHAEAAPTAAEATTRILPVVRPKPKPKPKAKPKKVTLCHKGKTVKVPKSQVKKHRKHGDKLGACKKPKRTR